MLEITDDEKKGIESLIQKDQIAFPSNEELLETQEIFKMASTQLNEKNKRAFKFKENGIHFLKNYCLCDVSVHERRREDELFLNNPIISYNVRRGLTFLIEKKFFQKMLGKEANINYKIINYSLPKAKIPEKKGDVGEEKKNPQISSIKEINSKHDVEVMQAFSMEVLIEEQKMIKKTYATQVRQQMTTQSKGTKKERRKQQKREREAHLEVEKTIALEESKLKENENEQNAPSLTRNQRKRKAKKQKKREQAIELEKKKRIELELELIPKEKRISKLEKVMGGTNEEKEKKNKENIEDTSMAEKMEVKEEEKSDNFKAQADEKEAAEDCIIIEKTSKPKIEITVEKEEEVKMSEGNEGSDREELEEKKEEQVELREMNEIEEMKENAEGSIEGRKSSEKEDDGTKQIKDGNTLPFAEPTESSIESNIGWQETTTPFDHTMEEEKEECTNRPLVSEDVEALNKPNPSNQSLQIQTLLHHNKQLPTQQQERQPTNIHQSYVNAARLIKIQKPQRTLIQHQENLPISVARKGLCKFFDLTPDFIRKSKDNFPLYNTQANYILCPLINALHEGHQIQVYYSRKANGENVQVSYLSQFDAFVVSSKNVSILITEKESTSSHHQFLINQGNDPSRYEYAMEMAKVWLKMVSWIAAIGHLDALKLKMANHTFVGEHVGNQAYQHLIRYKEVSIHFYAIVKNDSKLCCLDPEETLKILKQFNLVCVKTQSLGIFHNYSDLQHCLAKIYKDVAISSIHEGEEGAVLYFIKRDRRSPLLNCCLSLCKLKTLEYRLYRKLREKLKTYTGTNRDKSQKTHNASEGKKITVSFTKESKKLLKETLEQILKLLDEKKNGLEMLPKPFAYYERVAERAIEFINKHHAHDTSFSSLISNRYVDFIYARIAEVDCYYLNSFLQLCGKPVPILVAPPFSLEIALLEEKYNRITLEDIVNQSYKVKLQNSDMKSILLHLYTIPSFNNCLPQQLEVFRQIPWLICGYGDDKWSIESFLSKEKRKNQEINEKELQFLTKMNKNQLILYFKHLFSPIERFMNSLEEIKITNIFDYGDISNIETFEQKLIDKIDSFA